MASLKYWVWLTSRRSISNATVLKLVGQFGTPENVFFADVDDYKGLSLSEKEITSLMDKSMSRVSNIMEQCETMNADIMTISDSTYPERLKNICDPPAILYIRGKLPIIDDEAVITIIGTRKSSAYGMSVAERISYETAKCGGIVATGLAAGIDSAAAVGALKAGGKVIGVLGNGIDVVYPKSNRRLYEDVINSGAIISEFTPGTAPHSWNFPKRNRVMGGLAVGVAVIESPAKGGALITAADALEQGKDLFAVPGNIDAVNSVGTNRLIREGAMPITCGYDMIREYEWKFPGKLKYSQTQLEQDSVIAEEERSDDKNFTSETNNQVSEEELFGGIDGDELEVAEVLKSEELHVDDIIKRSGLSANKVLAALTMLQIKGYASETDGKRFVLNIEKK